jgi:hypothetical protein
MQKFHQKPTTTDTILDSYRYGSNIYKYMGNRRTGVEIGIGFKWLKIGS